MEYGGEPRLDCARGDAPTVDSREFIGDNSAQTLPAERRPTGVVGSRYNQPLKTTGVELIRRAPGRRDAIFDAVTLFSRPAPMRMVLCVCVCVAAIAAFSLVPGDFRPHSFLRGQAEHFVAYAGTGLFVAFGFTMPRESSISCKSIG